MHSQATNQGQSLLPHDPRFPRGAYLRRAPAFMTPDLAYGVAQYRNGPSYNGVYSGPTPALAEPTWGANGVHVEGPIMGNEGDYTMMAELSTPVPQALWHSGYLMPGPVAVQGIKENQRPRPKGRKARLVCSSCHVDFGRRQEFKRHMKDLHTPRRRCLFCDLMWTRPNIIKTHLISNHAAQFTAEVLEGIKALRGQRVMAFLDAYNYDSMWRGVHHGDPGQGQNNFQGTGYQWHSAADQLAARTINFPPSESPSSHTRAYNHGVYPAWRLDNTLSSVLEHN